MARRWVDLVFSLTVDPTIDCPRNAQWTKLREYNAMRTALTPQPNQLSQTERLLKCHLSITLESMKTDNVIKRSHFCSHINKPY
jgi:hypothetical protein